MVKEYRISALSVSLIMFVLGLILTIKPVMSVRIICYIIAAGCVALAISRVVASIKMKKSAVGGSTANLLFALIFLGIAAYIAFNPDSFAGIIPVILGVFILVDGAVLILTGITYRDYLPRRGLSSLLFGVLLVFLGGYSILHGFEVQVILMRFLGIALFISGGSNIINQLMLERADRKRIDATTVDFEVHKSKD